MFDREGVVFLFYLPFMKWLSLIAFIIILTSCSESAVSKKLTECDSLSITFNAPNTDSIVKTLQTVDKNGLSKMAGFLGGKTTEQFKCGYDGGLIFFTKGKAFLPVMFKYKEADCRHFLFEWEGKTMSTKMSQEAADFLESLEMGKSTY